MCDEQKETQGNIYCIECPVCGKDIENLRDYGNLNAGDEVDCPHCDAEIMVKDVDITVDVTLTANRVIGGKLSTYDQN